MSSNMSPFSHPLRTQVGLYLQESQAADGALTLSTCDELCACDLRELFDVGEKSAAAVSR